MSRRVKHVIRDVLPWQPPSNLTECSREIGGRLQTITQEEFRARAKRAVERFTVAQKQVVAFGGAIPKDPDLADVCQMCVEKMRHWSSWDKDPIIALRRAVERFGWYDTGADAYRFRAEMITLAELVDNHLDEYRAALAFRLLALQSPRR